MQAARRQVQLRLCHLKRPPPPWPRGAEAGGRFSDASPQSLQPNMPNEAEGIREDSGSRWPGNDIVAEVTDIVAEGVRRPDR